MPQVKAHNNNDTAAFKTLKRNKQEFNFYVKNFKKQYNTSYDNIS